MAKEKKNKKKKSKDKKTQEKEKKTYDREDLNNKFSLNVKEASFYYGIGECKLRGLANIPRNSFTIKVGKKILFKRELFTKYLETREFL